MKRGLSILLFGFVLGVGVPQRLIAEEAFYEGKTIKVVVGFTSGGFYDRWSRLLARYVPKYLPGNPEIICPAPVD